MKIFTMSSISKAGIFIDIKQLLGFTDQMVGYMTAVDRKRYGDRLVQYNLDMIAQFTLAYHRRDERRGIVKDYEKLKITIA